MKGIIMGVYLEPNELKDTYFEAERVAKDWMKPFVEYERIAGNKLSKLLGKNMPKVNDGSLAASLLETPMNVLPSMQPGKFISTGKKTAWYNEVANIIWKTKIVPNANTQAAFFDKEQIALYRALKYGAQPRYNFFVSTENYTGSDWSLPYIKNVKLEPGKFSVEDCDYVFLDIYYTKLQLKRLIQQQKDEVKKAKTEGYEPDTTWNVDILQKLADMAMTSKEYEEQNINERDKKVFSSGIKTTTCFQRGVDAPFYMFSKHLEPGELLREWKNPDPTGDLPITMQYCYENLESPYGIGRVELAGPTQNVLDYMTQAHVLATQLGLQPAKKISGPIDTANMGSIVNAPDALWVLGQAQIDLVQSTSPVYTQFPANFGLYKSQLQTLQGRTDGSVSAESGNPSYSKTPQGLKQQEARTNSQDNYLRGKADSASAKMAEKMMNVHMAKMQGADILDIVEEDAIKLKAAGFFDDNPMTPEPGVNEIPIIYDDIRDTFKFEYDPRPESDEDEKNRLLELLDIYASNPNLPALLQQDGYKFGIGEVFKGIVASSGVLNDRVLTKLDETNGNTTDGSQEIDPVTGQPIQPEVDPNTGQPIVAQEPPQEQANDAGAEGPEQMEATPVDPADVQAVMKEYGVDENIAMAMIEATKQGFSEKEILDYLGGNNG
jgi:hypothetical protein